MISEIDYLQLIIINNLNLYYLMLRLNAQIGFNPLRHHRPYQCIRTSNNSYSLGENGEIVAWKSDLQPLYQIVPSVNADTDKLIAFSVSPLRLISSEEKSMKIVTIHEDGRLRIFNAIDGLCVNVTSHNIFPQKINGIVENEEESRFILCFSEQKIFIFDIWIMKVIDTLQLSIQAFSIYVRGRITEKLQLEMMDKQGKMFRFDVSTLYSDNFLDVGSYVSSAPKAFQTVEKAISEMKSEKTVSSYKKIPEKHSRQALQEIKNELEKIRQTNRWQDIFNSKFASIPCIDELIKQNQHPTVSNLYFLKGNKLWYFFGTSTGKVLGLPAIFQGRQQIVVTISEVENGPVAYIQFLDNLMVVSWAGGLFNVYTVDNLQFTINEQLALVKKSKDQTCYVSPEKNKIFSKKMSAQVKYRLDIYNTNKGKVGLQIFAFQLINNQVFIFDTIHRKCINFRGLPQDSRIFTILQCEDYIGIAHTKGVDMYSGDRFERQITYDKWIWSDFQFCQRIQYSLDYHNIGLKKQCDAFDFSTTDGINLIKFCDRFHTKKLDFYSLSSDLLYETFGLVEDQQIFNQMYPTFHFIQKAYTQKIIHSICTQNATSVLKMKLQNIRRDKTDNTSFLLSLNLNKQLQVWNEETTKIDQLIHKNFTLFSLFFWDQNFIPHLTQIYANSDKKFIFKRRFVEQGIGKSFTIYFDNHSKHYLSQNLLTLSALSSTAFLQILASKDIELTDSMVETVEFFTTKRQKQQNKINPQLLSKMSLSESSFILKVCINLLMSTALTEHIPLHPIYEYFILNLKNLEDTKIKEVSDTQTVWITYLGVGLIYSDQIFDKEQIKVLINRILSSLEMKNFELHQDLVIIILKVLNEGIKKWKPLINSGTIVKLLTDLFKIFFLYDGLITVSQDDKKFDFRFQKISPNQSKKMKLQIVKTIVYLSKEFGNQFLQVLRIQALNQKPHAAYPSSVVQILRQYLKTEKPNTNLVFFVQLLLQCLSPMTPQLRKYVQKNVLQTLQIMCSYQTISFNHTSQKLSVRTDSNIYIYCLRTSTKWRTITIKQQLPPEMSVLKMSPKGTYIALLGDKLKIWRLSSGFWSGVLGAFSQGWTFEATGKALKWDDSEESITVINENPSLNKCFKL